MGRKVNKETLKIKQLSVAFLFITNSNLKDNATIFKFFSLHLLIQTYQVDSLNKQN